MIQRSGLRSNAEESLPARDPVAAALIAVRAAESKKASDIRVLDLREIGTFTDFFVFCNGANARQIQTICDEVELQLKRAGEFALGIEGYGKAEWILADYGDLIVHIFAPAAREFYGLERLWRQAKEVTLPEAAGA
jgi:ribosome-associated protein